MALAYIHPGEVAGAFMESVTTLMLADASGARRIVGPHGGIISMQSSPRIAEARTQVVLEFLKADGPVADAEWLWFVDADMTFDHEALEQLVASAIDNDADVMGGLCFAGGRGGRLYPTVYRLLRDERSGTPHVEPVMDYPRHAVVKVGATGAACMLIRRSLLVAMAAPHPHGFGTLADGRPNPYPWFVEGLVDKDGRPMGEDIAFCLRAAHLQAGIYIDTAVKVGHVKSYELNEELFDLTRALQSAQAMHVHDPAGPSPLVATTQEDDAGGDKNSVGG